MHVSYREGCDSSVIEVRDSLAQDIWFLCVMVQGSYQSGRVVGTPPPSPPPSPPPTPVSILQVTRMVRVSIFPGSQVIKSCGFPTFSGSQEIKSCGFPIFPGSQVSNPSRYL